MTSRLKFPLSLALCLGLVCACDGGSPPDGSERQEGGDRTHANDGSDDGASGDESASPDGDSDGIDPDGEADGAADGGGDDDGGQADGDDGDGPGGPPVFAFVTQVFAPMGQTSYIVLSDSVQKTRTLTLASGVELPGRAIGAGPSGQGRLYVGGSEGGELTRYDLSRDGKSLIRRETVSFAGLGITSIGEYQEQLQFISDRKAYYLDGRTAQLVVFDPDAMLIERTIDLGELVIDGQLLTFATSAIFRGDDLIFPLGWRSDVAADIYQEAAVLIIHTRDDSFEVARDDRCGYVRTAARGADGRLYLATEAYGSAVHRVVPARAPAPCLVRLDEGGSAFDRDFHVPLASLVFGATAGTLLPGPTPGQAWLRVLDERTTHVGPETHPRVLASSPAWAWWKIALGDTPSAEAAPLGLSNGSDFLLNTVDGAVIPEFAPDRSQTVLRDISAGTPGDSTVTIPGLTFSIVRLR